MTTIGGKAGREIEVSHVGAIQMPRRDYETFVRRCRVNGWGIQETLRVLVKLATREETIKTSLIQAAIEAEREERFGA